MNALSPSRLFLLAGFLILSVGSNLSAGEKSDAQAELNGGYYLLHQLCDDEAHLGLLLMVKDAPKVISTYAREVADVADKDRATLERLQDTDKYLKLDDNPLPPIELAVRDSIKDEKQHRLLFGTTGSDFVQSLLVSQLEASTYATNIAKVLAAKEKDPDRIRTLQRISAHWAKLRDEGYQLLKKD